MIENNNGQVFGKCDLCGKELNIGELFNYPTFNDDNEPLLVEVTIYFIHGEKKSLFLHKKGCFCDKCYDQIYKWKSELI